MYKYLQLVKDEDLRKQLELYFKTEKYLRLNGDASATGAKPSTISGAAMLPCAKSW
jgi:hypothetical protein